MREPTYPIIVVALTMLVAPAFAQREERGLPRLEEQRPLRTPERQGPLRVPEEQTPLRTQTFGGHAYHGQLAWRNGQWHHTTRDGRDGWWWDVGGFWYFYPVEGQPEGPPDYVSDLEVAEDATASPATPAPAEPNYAVYYRPGDFIPAENSPAVDTERFSEVFREGGNGTGPVVRDIADIALQQLLDREA